MQDYLQSAYSSAKKVTFLVQLAIEHAYILLHYFFSKKQKNKSITQISDYQLITKLQIPPFTILFLFFHFLVKFITKMSKKSLSLYHQIHFSPQN